jgi:hypothetical protein
MSLSVHSEHRCKSLYSKYYHVTGCKGQGIWSAMAVWCIAKRVTSRYIDKGSVSKLEGSRIAKRFNSAYIGQGCECALEVPCIAKRMTSGYIDFRSGSALEESYIARRITGGYIEHGFGITMEGPCTAKRLSSGYIDQEVGVPWRNLV